MRFFLGLLLGAAVGGAVAKNVDVKCEDFLNKFCVVSTPNSASIIKK